MTSNGMAEFSHDELAELDVALLPERETMQASIATLSYQALAFPGATGVAQTDITSFVVSQPSGSESAIFLTSASS